MITNDTHLIMGAVVHRDPIADQLVASGDLVAKSRNHLSDIIHELINLRATVFRARLALHDIQDHVRRGDTSTANLVLTESLKGLPP